MKLIEVEPEEMIKLEEALDPPKPHIWSVLGLIFVIIVFVAFMFV